MQLTDLLIGKTAIVKTEVLVEVELEITKVETNHHSENLEESNAANDWWPATRDWQTYTIHFSNGAKKTYHSLNELKIKELLK